MNTCKLWKISLFDYLITTFPLQQEEYGYPDTIVRNAFASFEDCRNVSYRKRNICGLLQTDDGFIPKNPLSPQILLLQPFVFPHVDNLCTLLFSCLLASAFTIHLHLLKERYFRNKQAYSDSPKYLNKYGNLLRHLKGTP